MPKKYIITPNEVFGRLTIINECERSGVHRMVLARCQCQTEKIIRYSSIVRGDSRSCGCLNVERSQAANTRHGHASKQIGKSKEYRAWESMLYRCEYETCPGYPNYGGRGISVCDAWRKFESFLSDMGLAPTPQHSLDRINVMGNYEPSNCRWATDAEQANNKTVSRFYDFNGKQQTVANWARSVSMKKSTLETRLKNGMPFADALTLPLRRVLSLP